MPSATTRAREARARKGNDAAVAMLNEGHTLRVSSRTDADAKTVHHGLARKLVSYGVAEYPPDPEREGWKDMRQIRKK